MNRAAFYRTIRAPLFNGSLKQKQVEGINVILDYWDRSQLTDLRWLGYMLGTTYHETARTMQPIEEYGKGKGYKYGKNIKRSGVAYDFYAYPFYYYGRGFVQLTWFENYETMGRLINRPLLLHPELALQADVAAEIMFEGMTKGNSMFGDFTGKSLEMYFNDKKADWINARRIINGLDKAEAIAKYSKTFYNALL
jgi:putative chitinase